MAGWTWSAGAAAILAGLAASRAVPDARASLAWCDQRNPRNVGRPFGDAVTKGIVPSPALLVAAAGVKVEGRPVGPLPDRGSADAALRTDVRAALAERRTAITELCRHGGGPPFDHTLLFMAEATIPAGVFVPLLEDARSEGFEDLLLVTMLRMPPQSPAR